MGDKAVCLLQSFGAGDLEGTGMMDAKTSKGIFALSLKKFTVLMMWSALRLAVSIECLL